MAKLKMVLVIFAALIVASSCKKEDIILHTQESKGLKSSELFDEVLLHSILNQVDFDFDAYSENDEVENAYTVIVDGQSYGVFITNVQEKLDAWIAAEVAVGKETGSFVVQELLVGLSKSSNWSPLIIPASVLNNSVPMIQFDGIQTVIQYNIYVAPVKRYAILTTSGADREVIRFGFVSNTSHQTLFNSLTEIFDHVRIMIDEDEIVCYETFENFHSTNFGKVAEWMYSELQKGRNVCVEYEGGVYYAMSWEKDEKDGWE